MVEVAWGRLLPSNRRDRRDPRRRNGLLLHIRAPQAALEPPGVEYAGQRVPDVRERMLRISCLCSHRFGEAHDKSITVRHLHLGQRLRVDRVVLADQLILRQNESR
jgi:hypothetical protein